LRERKAGKGDGVRAKSKAIATDATDPPTAKKAPAPAVAPVAPKIVAPVVAPDVSGGPSVRPSDVATADTSVAAKPAARPSPKLPGKGVSQTGNTGAGDVPAKTLTDDAGKKYEGGDKNGRTNPKRKSAPGELGLAKRSVTGPTTRPSGPVQVAGRVQGVFVETNNSGELEILSSQIAKEQKSGESGKQLEQQYSKLNKAFRQQILNDDLRRNVQSQQAKGVNIQALVININRRSLGSFGKAAATGGVLLRDGGALSRPRAATTSAPVSESTTQRAAQQVDTSR